MRNQKAVYTDSVRSDFNEVAVASNDWLEYGNLIDGELDNSVPGKVTGWICFFRHSKEPLQVSLDLSGDFHDDVRGKVIRLSNSKPSDREEDSDMEGDYATERFLYRLAISPHGDRFILKGTLLLAAWQAPQSRPTVDIDLKGRLNNDLETMATVIKDVCQIESTPDGIHFDPATLEIRRIKEDADYEGVRARFDGSLAKARIRMQLDIAFGDVIVCAPGVPTLSILDTC
jgi:hypothetical protein